MSNPDKTRRPQAIMSVVGTNSLHLRHPAIMAFWSFAFPGFGHLLLHKYIRGYLLILWEMVINIKAEVNLSMYYSFTGQFELAKQTIDLRWYLLYTSVFVFAIWDSYRTTVDSNNLFTLARREGAPISAFKMNVLEFNYLDKRKPWNSAIWSALMPGTGQLLIHRIPTAFFILIWWIAIAYYSHLIQGFHYTLLGDFSKATKVLDVHWLLFMPSIYMFSIYDAYINTVEFNKVFESEQASFLKKGYQNENFVMPLN
ncbi:MAG TPA: hypothetical protein VGE40_03975 [Bacilli bacterium]